MWLPMTSVFILAKSEDKKMRAYNEEVEGVMIFCFWSRGYTTSEREVSGWTRGIFKAYGYWE